MEAKAPAKRGDSEEGARCTASAPASGEEEVQTISDLCLADRRTLNPGNWSWRAMQGP
jgi:hypothetical protein